MRASAAAAGERIPPWLSVTLGVVCTVVGAVLVLRPFASLALLVVAVVVWPAPSIVVVAVLVGVGLVVSGVLDGSGAVDVLPGPTARAVPAWVRVRWTPATTRRTPRITTRTPKTTATTSTVTSGHARARTPSTTDATPSATRVQRSTPPDRTPSNPSRTPATPSPTATSTATTTIEGAGHTTTATASARNTSPRATCGQRGGCGAPGPGSSPRSGERPATSSVTPRTTAPTATAITRRASDANGRRTRAAPTSAHTTPSVTDTHGGTLSPAAAADARILAPRRLTPRTYRARCRSARRPPSARDVDADARSGTAPGTFAA